MNITFSRITKRFGPVTASDGVDLELRAGEVTSILGENGAGKSTLMKMLYGVVTPDSGEIRLDGKTVRIDSARTARALGVGMVFQQFSLVPAFTVEENLLLGAEGLPLFFRGKSAAREQARAVIAAVAPQIDPRRLARDLAVGEKQLVEIAKVLARGARVIVLDEPSSVLTELETEQLWQRLRALASEGRTVVFVTHKLADVRAAADRAVVMRAGKLTLDTTDVTDGPALVRAAVGRDLPPVPSRSGPAGAEPRLVARGAALSDGGVRLDGLDVTVSAGEILGIAGVTGNGQEQLGRLLAGVAPPSTGSVLLDGKPVRASDAAGIAYIPEQPLLNGVAPELSVLRNLTALGVRRRPFWLNDGPFRATAAALIRRFDVKPADLERPAGALSGGNVQKLVAARELGGEPRLIVACFPTMGLDAAASRLLTDALVEHANRGAAVVWISEDLDALLTYADRIGVLYRGALRGPVAARDATAAVLGAWMTGAAA